MIINDEYYSTYKGFQLDFGIISNLIPNIILWINRIHFISFSSSFFFTILSIYRGPFFFGITNINGFIIMIFLFVLPFRCYLLVFILVLGVEVLVLILMLLYGGNQHVQVQIQVGGRFRCSV